MGDDVDTAISDLIDSVKLVRKWGVEPNKLIINCGKFGSPVDYFRASALAYKTVRNQDCLRFLLLFLSFGQPIYLAL